MIIGIMIIIISIGGITTLATRDLKDRYWWDRKWKGAEK